MLSKTILVLSGAPKGYPTGWIPANDEEMTFLLGGKQLAYAFYYALKKWPDNENVQRVLKEGYTVLIRSEELPRVARFWLKDLHNSQHGGCKVTFSEMLQAVSTVEATWDDEQDDKQFSPQSLPTSGKLTYAKLYAKHVQQFYLDTYPTYDCFKDCRAIVNDITLTARQVGQGQHSRILEVAIFLLMGSRKLAVQILLCWDRFFASLPFTFLTENPLCWDYLFFLKIRR